jgi:hypothetical protein
MDGAMNAGRKSLLFLKKKKQKDFYTFAPHSPWACAVPMYESFLVLFFKKEHPCFLDRS